jgi:hypothetical protein
MNTCDMLCSPDSEERVVGRRLVHPVAAVAVVIRAGLAPAS